MNVDTLILRQYAWDYFLAHAQARLTTFRFYLFYCSFIMAGLFAILSKGDALWIGALLSFLLAFISYIYRKIDIRHKQIINRAQEALIDLEEMMDLPDQDGGPNKLKLFSREKFITSGMPRFPSSLSASAHCSYSTSVNMLFYLFITIGLVGGFGIIIFLLC